MHYLYATMGFLSMLTAALASQSLQAGAMLDVAAHYAVVGAVPGLGQACKPARELLCRFIYVNSIATQVSSQHGKVWCTTLPVVLNGKACCQNHFPAGLSMRITRSNLADSKRASMPWSCSCCCSVQKTDRLVLSGIGLPRLLW